MGTEAELLAINLNDPALRAVVRELDRLSWAIAPAGLKLTVALTMEQTI